MQLLAQEGGSINAIFKSFDNTAGDVRISPASPFLRRAVPPNVRVPSLEWVAGVLFLGAAYWGAAKLGQTLRYTASVSAIWPPAGLGIAALYLWGLRWWPGILIGAFLAVLILFVFLREGRTTVIASTSLPLSVIGTFFFLYLAGGTLNLMTLGGLAIAIGLIIDDAVVVIENIYRHLGLGEQPTKAAENGTRELLGPVIGSTATTLVVFLPLGLLLQGVAEGGPPPAADPLLDCVDILGTHETDPGFGMKAGRHMKVTRASRLGQHDSRGELQERALDVLAVLGGRPHHSDVDRQ